MAQQISGSRLVKLHASEQYRVSGVEVKDVYTQEGGDWKKVEGTRKAIISLVCETTFEGGNVPLEILEIVVNPIQKQQAKGLADMLGKSFIFEDLTEVLEFELADFKRSTLKTEISRLNATSISTANLAGKEL
jgi:hypothetical protein